MPETSPTCLMLGAIAWHASPSERRAMPIVGQQGVVLAVLAAAWPDPVSADRLADVLWGDDPPETFRTGLQVVVRRLRLRVGDEAIVTDGGYRLAVDRDDLDIASFEEAHNAAQTAGCDADLAGQALDHARRGLALWRGEPFAGVDHPVLDDRRRSLVELRSQLAELETGALLAIGDIERAVVKSVELVSREPLRDRSWILRMTALDRAGRRADALDSFQQYRRTLANELALDPSAEVVELERRILDGRSASGEQVLRAVDVRPTPSRWQFSPPALAAPPAPADRFVGRADECARLASALEAHRVVNLVGPAGVGKSRLALEVLRALPGDPLVIWVDLAVEAPDRVSRRLGEAVGTIDPSNVDELARVLARRAMSRPTFVVFDNAEHVLDETSRLVERFVEVAWAATADGNETAAGTGLQVLVTSRARPVSTTAATIEPATIELAPLSDPDGVELLAERSRPDHLAAFIEGDEAAAVVAAVDGLPLALELVAPRIGAVDGPSLLSELRHSNRLLRVGREALDHRLRDSVDDLAPRLQSLFARLSPFGGVFDADGVAAVAGIDPASARRDLEALADRSLVGRDHDQPLPRFRLLETTRRHCGERAQAAGELASAQLAHRRHYAAEAVRLGRHLRGSGEAEAAVRLDATATQFGIAWRSALDDGDVTAATQLVAGLGEWSLYRLRGRTLRWARTLFDRGLVTTASDRIDLAGLAARAEWGRGRIDDAVMLGEMALAEAAAVSQAVPIQARFALVSAYGARGDIGKAADQLSAAGHEAEVLDDDFYRVGLRCTDSMGLSIFGLVDEARRRARDARTIAERLGNRSSIAWAILADAQTRVDDEPGRSQTAMEIAMEEAGAVRNRLIEGLALSGVAACQRRLQAFGASAQSLVTLIDHWEQSELAHHVVHLVGEAALTLDGAGRTKAADDLLARLDPTEIGHPHLRSDADELARLRQRRPGRREDDGAPLTALARAALEAIAS